MSKFESENSEDVFALFSPVTAGTELIGGSDAFEFNNFRFLLKTLFFFVNASLIDKIQSAADIERRDGNSNPSWKVLQRTMIKNERRKEGTENI